MKKFLRGPMVYIIILLAIVLMTQSFGLLGQSNTEEIEYFEFLQKVEKNEVAEVAIMDTTLVGRLKESNIQEQEFPDKYDFMTEISSEEQFNADMQAITGKSNPLEYGIEVVYLPTPEPSFLATLLPYLIPIILLVVVWYFLMRQSQGGNKAMSFGKSKAKMSINDQNRKTFDDVAGADEEKEELKEIVEFLKNPKNFIALGARIPKGVLLVGPPGGGKTLLAKAVAGEAGVPFFSISGSDFVEMFVGVGASRVRDLFENAKKNAPCIIFIDEIDAVGRHRGAGLGGGHDEREQTLNQLLGEMDGFQTNEGIIVLAATNRKDILDPALLRPGRFDRQIVVNYPDVKGREEILKVHAKGKPLSKDIDLKILAKRTPGFIGADLENVLNEAAILAARRHSKLIEMVDVEEAITRVIAGPEKKSRVVSEYDKKCTAYHEVGHAICAKVLPNCDVVHEVSIIPRGMAAGYTMTLPDEDKTHLFRSKMYDEIAMMLGGRVAESLTLGDISTGASNDIQRATELARKMVINFGMSDLVGPIYFGGEQEVFLGKEFGHTKNYSEEVASQIDGEVKRIIMEAYHKAETILKDNKDKLYTIAEVLIKKEKITGEEFDILFQGGTLPEEDETPKTPEINAQAEDLGQESLPQDDTQETTSQGPAQGDAQRQEMQEQPSPGSESQEQPQGDSEPKDSDAKDEDENGKTE